MLDRIKKEVEIALRALLDTAKLEEDDIFVIGCSTSEVTGHKVGTFSSLDVGRALFETVYPILCEKKLRLAVQCCEHLNRAIIMERAAAEAYGYEIIAVVPQPKAGGSFATVAYANMTDPVAVEEISAHAGIDIGGTLIGMHLRRVAVPLRLTTEKIGEARILCAHTRPKYIGGCRAFYEWDSSREDLYRV